MVSLMLALSVYLAEKMNLHVSVNLVPEIAIQIELMKNLLSVRNQKFYTKEDVEILALMVQSKLMENVLNVHNLNAPNVRMIYQHA